ncbi:MAG: NAD(P)-binding protein, partial [Gemmatales bacterium]|nr:NAD(P)-binding protein [Gemmatales bacterium]
MSLRVRNLRVGLSESEQVLPERVAQLLGLRREDILHWRILRKSLDARDKHDLAFVYSIEVNVPDELQGRFNRAPRTPESVVVEPYIEPPFSLPEPGHEPLQHPPVIIGSGPAGLAAAYFLAQYGYRPIVLERGKPVRERIHDIR